MKIPFCGGAYLSRSSNINAQRCVNLYPTVDSHEGKSQVQLQCTPGLVKWSTVGSGPIRGLLQGNNASELYVVSSSGFYTVDTSGAATLRGNMKTYTGPVSMAYNTHQVIIVDCTDFSGWIYDYKAHTWNQITDVNFPTASSVIYQDTFFIITKPGTDEMHICNNEDGTDWTSYAGTSWIRAEGSPDLGVVLVNNHREIWFFNDTSTEVYYNSGDNLFPFDRIQGAYIEMGCAAPLSAVKADNSIFWLGKDIRGQGVVCRNNGYTPMTISTRAMEYSIAQYPTISDAFAYVYMQEGHTFYVLSFPSGNATWVFDASTQMWHQRSFWSGISDDMHLGSSHALFNGLHLIGSRLDGRIFYFSLDAFTDDGNPIRRIRAAQHQHADRKRLFWHSLELDVEAGVGLDGGVQGYNPQIMLRWSDDGGHTWSGEKWASLGMIGEFRKRIIWRRLGQSRDRVFEVTVTDPVKVTIIDGHANVSAGDM